MSSYETTHPKLPGRVIEIEAPDLRVWRVHRSGPEAGYELDGFFPVYAYIYYHEDKKPGKYTCRKFDVTDHPELCDMDRLEEQLIKNYEDR